MQHDVVLCYIAKKVDECSHSDYTIKFYKDAWWLPLEPFRYSFDEIITKIVAQWSPNFYAVSVAEPECTYLAIYVRNYALTFRNIGQTVMQTFRCLLSLLMKDYCEDLCLSTELAAATNVRFSMVNERLTKKYVTTPLYELLYDKHLVLRKGFENIELQLPERLQPTLYGYQRSTVQWLLKRELQVEHLPAFYKKMEALDGKHCAYKHRFCVHLQMEAPAADIILPLGGILADEMGLGKTVEMLALILLNPRTHVNPMIEVDEHGVREKGAKMISDFLCICGVRYKGKKHSVKQLQCTKCEMWQHKACVTKHNVNHSTEINEPYICPDCWYQLLQQQPIETAATFIVTPNLIKKQWVSEIERHVNPGLRLLVYEGVTSGRWISPRQLADYDLVITDYNVLCGEFYHIRDNESTRKLRNAPRAMRVQTPLLMVQWWRVCLDEAQMIESNTANAAKLVAKLPAVNRWSVTGTPITRSIDDLQPLLRFIGFKEAFEPSVIWDNLVLDFLLNYEVPDRETPLIEDILQKVMWRTCKSKVTNELVIPPQSEVIHRLDLYNLEQLFYSDHHLKCEEKFLYVLEKILNHKEKLCSITPSILKSILQPLLKIRQCCNMPLIATNKQSALTVDRFLGPEELHAHLIADTEQEVRTELRSMASCFNGIAAIHFIKNNYQEALKYYINVLKLAKDPNDENITVDSLLQIHALHNIVQVHFAMPAESRLLSNRRIEQYIEERNKLEWKYLETSAATLASVQLKYQKSQSNCSCGQIDFYNVLTQATLIIKKDFDLGAEFMKKINDELRSYWLAVSFQSVDDVSIKLRNWLIHIEEMRKAVKVAFENLAFFLDNIRSMKLIDTITKSRVDEFVREVYDCHLKKLRQDNTKKDKEEEEEEKIPCKLCQMTKQLKKYEGLFFNNAQTEATESPSIEMHLFKAMISFVKSKLAFRKYEFKPILEKQVEDMECQQSAVKKLMKLWIEIEYVVKAYDELDMCKLRVSLTRNPSERNNFTILESETATFLQEQEYKFHEAQRQYVTKRGRLKYIKHLTANADPSDCPICHSEKPLRYAVLECGHHICYECLQEMRHIFRNTPLKCPICRNEQNSDTIYYAVVNLNKENMDNIEVIGKYSSKITFIVRLILKLLKAHSKQDGPLKFLIFSQWKPILNYISKALEENGITHCIKITPETIEQFKDPRLNITCLLMPFAKGCKGLNLIEATHIFLVEPILNPGDELQAIGRNHRFGQTKPTTVHRFIMNNTIEQNIFNVVSQGKKTKDNWEFNNMTVEDLRALFTLRNNITDQHRAE